MSFSFSEALNQNVDTIERPPLPPLGHYIWLISKVPVMTERGTFDIIEFPLQAVSATDDVDATELEAYGPLKKLNLRYSFLFNKEDDTAAQQTLARLRTFLEKHVKVDFEGIPLKQALNASVNNQIIGQLRYRADKENPEVQYAEIGKTAPLE